MESSKCDAAVFIREIEGLGGGRVCGNGMVVYKCIVSRKLLVVI